MTSYFRFFIIGFVLFGSNSYATVKQKYFCEVGREDSGYFAQFERGNSRRFQLDHFLFSDVIELSSDKGLHHLPIEDKDYQVTVYLGHTAEKGSPRHLNELKLYVRLGSQPGMADFAASGPYQGEVEAMDFKRKWATSCWPEGHRKFSYRARLFTLKAGPEKFCEEARENAMEQGKRNDFGQLQSLEVSRPSEGIEKHKCQL